MQDNLYTLFKRRFPNDTAQPFIEVPDNRTLSWVDIDTLSGRYANFLRQKGLSKGARVAAQVSKSPEALVLYLACLRTGVIYLPLNPAYTEREVEYFVQDASPSLFVCDPDRETSMIKLVEERNPGCHIATIDAGNGTLEQGAAGCEPTFVDTECAADDIASLIYTSGTTGRPKGVMLSHGNLMTNALALHAAWGWQPGDVLLHALPLFHVHGLFVACHCALLNGSKMLFLPKFDVAEVLRLLPHATVMMGVPTFYTRLLASSDFGVDTCANVRLFVSGSAPLLEETFHDFSQRTGHTILERYGMSETVMNTSNPLEGKRMAGTVGLPLPGISVRIIAENGATLPVDEVGAVQVKGPNVFKGYWNKPDKTADDFTTDGWFKTGDLGKLLPNGYLSLVGRAKDLVISGGYNIYPKEVELVLDDIPGVNESSVFGVQHPDFGETVAAAIVTEKPGATLDAEHIISLAREQLAGYKVPRKIHFLDELPRNAMGKVQKNVLREQFATQQ